LKYYDKLYLKSLKLRANTKNEGSDNDSKEDLVQKDNMIEQNQSKAYLENYKIEICSDIVDSKINSQKLLTAFYGRN
jgi:Zn-finger domain-containing protein